MRPILAFVALALVAGCLSQSNTPNPAPSSGSATLAASLSVEPGSIREGETARISGSVFNNGATAYPYRNPGCPAGELRFFVVVNGKEQPIPRDLVGACVVTDRTLNAGARIDDSMTWDGTASDGERLPAGRYTLVVRLNAVDRPPGSASVELMLR